MVLGKQRAHFVLKTSLRVVRPLCVDVTDERVEVGWTDGEQAISALPGEVVDALTLHPDGGGRFQVGDEVGGGSRCGNANGEVNVIGDAADAEAFAVELAGDAGEVGVEVRCDFVTNGGQAVFCAEDDMDQIEAQRLCHGGPFVSGFQPSSICTPRDLGLRPRLLCTGLSALDRFSLQHLGLRPRLLCGRAFGPFMRHVPNTPSCSFSAGTQIRLGERL